MKKKLLIAISFASILTLTLTSLTFAADPAYVLFTTDAPCAVNVLVTSYTDSSNQPGQMASGSTPWQLDTYPSTAVTFFYPANVICNGITYNFESVSPSNPVTSGANTITVTGHYVLPTPPDTDTTPPIWNVPASSSVEATGPAGAIVTYTAYASDPDDAVVSQSCSPASNSTFALGTTTVNCTATDTHGNTGVASFNVTVVDTTPPVLSLPSDMAVPSLDAFGTVVDFVATANDLVDGPISVVCSPVSGSLFSIGTTTVTCSAADSSGNKATGSFNIIVADNEPPVLTLPSDITVSATDAAGAVVNFVVTANDLVDGPLPATCLPISGSLFPLGPTEVSCQATDSQGNIAFGNFNVNVVDNEPPVLTLPADIFVTASDASGAVVNFTASAYDQVDGSVPATCSPLSGTNFTFGTTTINCSATDSNGNMATGGFNVIVQYTTAGFKCNGVPGHQILEPINADGSSIFKQGSTVPAKFRVCGTDGVAIGAPGTVISFKLVRIIKDDMSQTVDQSVSSTTPADTFRSGSRQWIFDINTKDLNSGGTYVFLITLNDGSSIQFQFSLK